MKEPIQVTEEVTILPASARIAARVPAAGAEVEHTTFLIYSQEDIFKRCGSSLG